MRRARPRTKPTTNAPRTFTDEQDGVIATRPATMPEAAPKRRRLAVADSLGEQPGQHRRRRRDRRGDECRAGAHRSTLVADPALKPYQPNHSRPAPSITNGRLCGRIGVVGQPLRRPRMIASTRPAVPALMCTAVPPAKSIAPKLVGDPAAVVRCPGADFRRTRTPSGRSGSTRTSPTDRRTAASRRTSAGRRPRRRSARR